MTHPSPDLHRRIMYVLYRALNDARSLALAGQSAQLAELTDAIENLPSEVNNWRDDSLEAIRFNLQTYRQEFPDANDYSRYLDRDPVPERF
jgi:hypothetical protein